MSGTSVGRSPRHRSGGVGDSDFGAVKAQLMKPWGIAQMMPSSTGA
ncbi:MAG: hypothetical protein K2H92_08185 [Bacteroidaceae bacterium]|nr:hypothetical protein [Bacteroidaceae bacterium]